MNKPIRCQYLKCRHFLCYGFGVERRPDLGTASLRIDPEGNLIYKDGVDLHFTKMEEFELMCCFVRHRGQILSHQQLLDLVWGLDYFGDPRTVDTHVRRLREKVGETRSKRTGGLATAWRRAMNKLGRKLFISILVSVLLIFVMYVLLANLFMPKYYIYKTKEQLREAINMINGLPEAGWIDAIPQIEQQYRVTIVYDDLQKRENDLNESLKQQLSKKRVTLN